MVSCNPLFLLRHSVAVECGAVTRISLFYMQLSVGCSVPLIPHRTTPHLLRQFLSMETRESSRTKNNYAGKYNNERY